MPRLDKTGPEGQGPMTGRKMGKCTNFGGKGKAQEGATANDVENIHPGRGLGRGLGLKRGGRGRGLGQQNRFRGGNK